MVRKILGIMAVPPAPKTDPLEPPEELKPHGQLRVLKRLKFMGAARDSIQRRFGSRELESRIDGLLDRYEAEVAEIPPGRKDGRGKGGRLKAFLWVLGELPACDSWVDAKEQVSYAMSGVEKRAWLKVPIPERGEAMRMLQGRWMATGNPAVPRVLVAMHIKHCLLIGENGAVQIQNRSFLSRHFPTEYEIVSRILPGLNVLKRRASRPGVVVFDKPDAQGRDVFGNGPVNLLPDRNRTGAPQKNPTCTGFPR